MSTSIVMYILVGLVGALLGAGVFALVRRVLVNAKRAQDEEQARQTVQHAQREAENIVKEAKLEAKDLVFQSKAELEKEQKAKFLELSTAEKRLVQREEAIDKRISILDKRDADGQRREQELMRKEEKLIAKEAACAQAEREHREALERVAGMTAEEAKKYLLQEMESQARLDAADIERLLVFLIIGYAQFPCLFSS
jgi:ribonuclease Y